MYRLAVLSRRSMVEIRLYSIYTVKILGIRSWVASTFSKLCIRRCSLLIDFLQIRQNLEFTHARFLLWL